MCYNGLVIQKTVCYWERVQNFSTRLCGCYTANYPESSIFSTLMGKSVQLQSKIKWQDRGNHLNLNLHQVHMGQISTYFWPFSVYGKWNHYKAEPLVFLH